MDADRIKGKMKDLGGRVERQAGEWTGDKDAEAEGTGRQAEGKVQNAFGKVKDKARDLADDMRRKKEEHDIKRDIDRDDKVA